MGKLFTKGMMMIAGAAGLILGSSAAALADDVLVAKVPFNFVVNGVQLPAGDYRVTSDGTTPVVSIRNNDGGHAAFVLTNGLSPEAAGPNPELVFERVNGTSFLSRIVGVESGREIPLPAKVLKQQERTRVAVLMVGSEHPFCFTQSAMTSSMGSNITSDADLTYHSRMQPSTSGVLPPGTRRERLLVLLIGCALTATLTYPTIPLFATAGRIDGADGRFSIWNVAWIAHSLLDDPRHLFDANIFHPHRHTLAYSELNLVAGVLATPVYAFTRNPFAAHNSAVLIALFVTFLAMWALVHRLTSSTGAGLVAATAYTFSAFTASHTAEIQLLMLFGFPLVMKGRNRDTAWFSMLDSEWPDRKARFEAWLDPANFDADGRQKTRLSPDPD